MKYQVLSLGIRSKAASNVLWVPAPFFNSQLVQREEFELRQAPSRRSALVGMYQEQIGFHL